MRHEPTVVAAGDRSRPLNVLTDQITVLATSEQTGSFEVFLISSPEGGGPPPHSHEWDEAFYLLRGEIVLTIDGVARTAGPGATVFIPGRAVHSFEVGADGAELLSITSCAGAAEVFAAIDADTIAMGSSLMS